MTATAIETSRDSGARIAGIALVLCGAASVLLLMNHPDGGASHALGDVLKAEAANALPDAIVHGSFVAVLAIALVGFAALAVRAGPRRTPVIAAMLFALIGAGLLSASMIVDGLIAPAVAARYVAATADKQLEARPVFVLIGAALSVLMPMGLAFQGAAAVAWGVALMPTRGRTQVVGQIGLALGAVILAAAAMSLQSDSPYPLFAALLASAAWMAAAGVLLTGWRAPDAD